jgi:uncharacterized iron-regulated membrane protein
LSEADRVTFDAASGRLLQQHAAHPQQLGAVQVHETIEALHKADFGGWPMKWLYFISGLLGTAMIAIGTLLFSIKRRKRSEHEFGAATAGIYRCVDLQRGIAGRGGTGKHRLPARQSGCCHWK